MTKDQFRERLDRCVEVARGVPDGAVKEYYLKTISAARANNILVGIAKGSANHVLDTIFLSSSLDPKNLRHQTIVEILSERAWVYYNRHVREGVQLGSGEELVVRHGPMGDMQGAEHPLRRS